MSDLIDREEAVKAVDEAFRMGDCYCDQWAIRSLLNGLPSAEPERKTGEWIDGMPYVNSHWKVCSECHVSAPDSCGGFNFCPNCGAEMRGENGKA